MCAITHAVNHAPTSGNNINVFTAHLGLCVLLSAYLDVSSPLLPERRVLSKLVPPATHPTHSGLWETVT